MRKGPQRASGGAERAERLPRLGGPEEYKRSTRSPGGGAWRRSAGMRPDSLRLLEDDHCSESADATYEARLRVGAPPQGRGRTRTRLDYGSYRGIEIRTRRSPSAVKHLAPALSPYQPVEIPQHVKRYIQKSIVDPQVSEGYADRKGR